MTQRELERTARRGSHHRPPAGARRHASLVALVALVVAVALIVVAVKVLGGSTQAPSPPSAQPQQVRYLGVYEPNAPETYTGVEQFAQAVGRQPNLVSYYSGWNEVFQLAFAQTAASHGATTIVQVDPTNISLAKIAAGKYDSYLNSFADQVAGFRHQVIISFGHEMNGYWETWGYHHTPPATFIAAWRHIVTLFRREGAENVTWMWQVNSSSALTGPVRDWWPGAQYVNWVGVSGYYYVPGNKFDNVFTPVITAVRKFTHDPLLIAETGVGPSAGQSSAIENLFAGLRTQNYLGLVYFDVHSYGGFYKGENWRLEDSQAAVTAFRNALKG